MTPTESIGDVSNTIRDMTGGDVFSRRITMYLLVVEKNISAKRSQKWPFWLATQKQGFINTNPPLSQCQDDPLMGGC